ncbi:PREDICTED: ABC transporter G family member 20-like [Nicotiana attenuata]|uniref:Abc transporter g family member 20 n=1 Tax=Nicotiana attenuata TaxID=49451 RepID=A0A1J6KH92_NICAT|nr:PREDICTED: ABC transporter G family member 20-like [Nicotiana attenuata]OIT21239.1 abc transporter g family member 20 [Nicotiana attenuata]
MELQEFGDSIEENSNCHDPLFPNPTSFPFVLSFHNLSYSVKVRRKLTVLPRCLRRTSWDGKLPGESTDEDMSRTKVLLNDISGEAREGEIMAVLGSSGSGKSTLIDALADRIERESLKGSVTLNGEVLESKFLKMISAYVMQDDLLFPTLTVQETLMFSAEFHLPRTLSWSSKKSRVEALIDQLDLQNAANTMIGDEGHRGVSGGERRRVSIGIGIIHDPILLFLDEPTSGLDSTSAYMVVKVLQKIAQSGSIVIMSIHQPSYRILCLLDRLIFLSCGQIVFGGSPTSIPQFFAEFGTPIPENENWAEVALDFIQELEETPNGTKNLVEFNRSWQRENPACTSFFNGPKPSLQDAISASVSRGKLVSGATNIDHNISSLDVPKFANPFWMEMVVIAKRSILKSMRMPELFYVRFGAVVATGIILATLFRKLDNSPKGIQEKLGFIAFAMGSIFYICLYAMPVFLQERYIFMRETAYNAYRRSSYVLSHTIISLPLLSVLSLTYALTTYWLVGLAGGFSGFILFFLFMFSTFWAANSFITFLSGVIYSEMVAYTVVTLILGWFMLLSGLFIDRDRIPPYWIWCHYLSPPKYPYQGVLQNEFDDPYKCLVKGIKIFDASPLKDVTESLKIELLQDMSKILGMNITNSTCLTTGIDILKLTAVNDLDKWTDLWITIALGIFYRILFYFALLIGSKNKRRRVLF